MPDIKIVNLGRTVTVGYGGNLRGALLANGVNPYYGIAKYVNCHGMGHCCTCVVKVLRGDVNEKTLVERLHPLRPRGEGERLSCQVRVYGNLEIDTLLDPEEAPTEAEEAEKATA